MSTRKNTKTPFEPTEFETIIARARRDRDAHIRNMFGAIFRR
ncbi:hypothetical protein [Oricola indica]